MGAQKSPTPSHLEGHSSPIPSRSDGKLSDILKLAPFDLWMSFILSPLINVLKSLLSEIWQALVVTDKQFSQIVCG